jgi:hypothetical protein
METLLITDDFTCESLGKQKETVYDIEVEDNHNFFANDICVHNSVYATFNSIVEKFISEDKRDDKTHVLNVLDQFAEKKICPLMDRLCLEIEEYLNCPNSVLKMAREVIADKGIWIAKKRYMLNVLDNEGVRYSKPKLKMMGIEAIKTSTPSAFRTNIKTAIEIMMNETEEDLQEFIKKFHQEMGELPIEEIAFPRGTNDLEKYQRTAEKFPKGTPIHVRAALLFNWMLKEKNLTDHYESIRSGDKIKFVYLKMPNPLKENVIGFMNEFPGEFFLREFVDFDTQFEKGFLKPLELITEIIKWETTKRNKLSDFFG